MLWDGFDGSMGRRVDGSMGERALGSLSLTDNGLRTTDFGGAGTLAAQEIRHPGNLALWNSGTFKKN